MSALPSSWSLTKVKYLADYINGYPFAPSEWSDEGKPIIRIQNLTNQNSEWNRTTVSVPERYNVEPGDILIAWSASLGVHVWEKESALLNQHIFKATPYEKVDKGFFKWTAKWFIEELQSQAHGSTMQHLTKDVFGGFDVPLPPPTFQVAIANFLDDKTARIDALIAEKERLLTSLTEWRAAELTRICFGEHLPQVITGNSWLPSLPHRWKVMRLKHLVTGIEQGWSPECEGRLAEQDEWGVLKAGAANAGVFREDEHKALPASLEPLPELEVKAGDVLVTRASGTADYVGSFAYVYATRDKLMLSDKNFRLKFGAERPLMPELLAWMCNTRVLREQILQYVSGADGLAKNIGSGNLRELWLAVPPIEIQPELIAQLHASRTRIDELAQHVVEHIARLREYRSSLISAAVTGQQDVSMKGVA